ncbi:chemotaxis protein CheA [Clostridium botulinum]|nr:chemotaxis protein CheA [Clostridium botulinum]
MDTSQYMSMFLEESMDNLQTLNDSLLQLEQEPDDIDKLNEIFRVAHTIKGMAATMGFNEMSELTHKMEDVLSNFREGDLKVTQNVVTVLFKCLDTLEQMVNNISEEVDEKVPIDHIIEELEKAANGDISSQENEKEAVETIEENKSEGNSTIPLNEYDLNVIKQAEDRGFNAYEIKHRTRLEQISTNHKLTDLNETLEQVARTTSDLQDLVMKIRMLPLDIVFNRFPRMVRDLSVELDKEMELIVQGADTELDRTVIDEIGEPLIHLIRNAADHGVEPREERVKKGKDPIGKIRLIAYQEGTKAVIKVEDDGGGVPVDKVKAKAERIGINTEGMSDNDIRNLIFAQGFSTNEKVTDISGRGVGMDVVKTKITALGGTVDLISEEGKGSSFIIRLPLTLQIIQALLVEVGSETMAISLGYIDRVIDYEKDIVKKTNNKEVIIYRGNVIPFVRVNEKLGLQESENDKKYIVIVKSGEKTVGLLVDGLLGQKEIVIKPFGKTLQGLKEYIGATILGDGLVTLILDVAALV